MPITFHVDRTKLRQAGLVLLVGALFCALASGGIYLTREHSRIAALWLPNAVLTAILLRRHGGSDQAYLAAGFIGNIAANLLAGDPLDRVIGLSVCNSLEVIIVTFAVRQLCGARPDMSNLRHLMTFSLIGGLIAPAITGLFACIVVCWPMTAPHPVIWASWVAADGLGMLILAPVLMIFADAWRDRAWLASRSLSDWLLIMGSGAAIAILPFTGFPFPIFFMAGPFVILAAFRLGTVGTAIAVVFISLVATVATATGHGFVRFLDPDLFSRLVVLQAFLAAVFGMSLPVAAALAGQDRLRRELDDSRNFMGSILDTMADVVFRTDARGCWTFLTPSWTQLTGRTIEQSIGNVSPEVLHADDRDVARAIWPDLVSGKISDTMFFFRVIKPDGECRHVEASVRRMLDGERFAGITGTIRDVTERKRTEHELASRDRQLDLLAKNATDAVLRLSLKAVCLYASPSSLDILRHEPRRLIGKKITQRVHTDDRAAFLDQYRALCNGTQDRAVLTFRLVPDELAGADVWLEANCGLVRSARGRPREIIASIRDISARKELELQLERARAQAEAADKAKTTFLANMSHEIRTPMNGVMGFTDLLLASDLDETQRRHVGLIADSGTAMMRLLSDILDISKVEAGQIRIADEATDIAQVLDACVKLLTPTAEQRGLDLRLELDPDLPVNFAGDGLRLSQIVMNLIGNALKFTPRGSVTLSASLVSGSGGAMLEVAVADTGIGISPQHQQHIFEQFMQVDQTGASRATGAGLGLAISSQLARLMGGEISLRSMPGRGSTFFLHIPARLTDIAGESIESPAPVTPAKRGARILVAEDNPINQALLEAMLGKLGHQAVIVSDGREAVKAANESAFDLVLMDVRMPELNGIEACRQIRRVHSQEKLPVLALTANAYPEDVLACREAGMQEELVKPVLLPELDAAIRRWIAAVPVTSHMDALVIDDALDAKYRARKQETLTRLDRMIRQGNFQGADVEALANIAHQLGGVAAMFDEAEVGVAAAQLVEVLENAPLETRGRFEPAFGKTLRALHRSMSK